MESHTCFVGVPRWDWQRRSLDPGYDFIKLGNVKVELCYEKYRAEP